MSATMAEVTVERAQSLSERDIADLCDATETAILVGGGFGWLHSPPRQTLERYWSGVVLVPERDLFVGRLDGVIVGSTQLVRPARNNEAQGFAASVTTHFVAPWARGHGIAAELLRAAEAFARDNGIAVLNLDVRATQTRAIRLYEAEGYVRWGTNPTYAIAEGKLIAGHYYAKRIAPLPLEPAAAGEGARP